MLKGAKSAKFQKQSRYRWNEGCLMLSKDETPISDHGPSHGPRACRSRPCHRIDLAQPLTTGMFPRNYPDYLHTHRPLDLPKISYLYVYIYRYTYIYKKILPSCSSFRRSNAPAHSNLGISRSCRAWIIGCCPNASVKALTKPTWGSPLEQVTRRLNKWQSHLLRKKGCVQRFMI